MRFSLEHPADSAAGCKIAVVTVKRQTHIAYGSVFVVGQTLDDDRGSLGPISLVDNLLVNDIAEFTGAFLDGTVNIFTGHICGTGFNQSHSQTRIRVRILAALLHADHDLFREF